MSNIIFFGPPGAGKGTQAKIISEYLNVPHLSTGDILRKKLLEKDNLAIELKKIMASGNLVSDDILNSIVSSRLSKESGKGFILDGYPRTLHQSEFLNNFLSKTSSSINYIFNIQINFETLKNRILKRSSEESREDDNVDVIETRYNEYLNSTQKVTNSYKDKYRPNFYELDGSFEIEEITQNIKEILKKSWKTAKIYHISTWLLVHLSCIHPHSFFLDNFMARISGVNIPTNKKVNIALTYIFGIGRKFALDICKNASIDMSKRVSELNEDEVNKIRDLIDKDYSVEGDLRRKISLDIKRLNDLGCYRGLRHRKKLPVRGQRTHTNARTRKGKAVAIAGKKKVTKG